MLLKIDLYLRDTTNNMCLCTLYINYIYLIRYSYAVEYRRIDFVKSFISFFIFRGTDDKNSYTNLLKELRTAFEGEAKTSKQPRLLLTAAVPASFEAIAAG